MSVSRKIMHKIKTAPDLEVHVSRIRVEDEELIELRNYVPSLKRYGRGILLRGDVFVRIVQEIGPDVIEHLWPKGVPGPGQGALV